MLWWVVFATGTWLAERLPAAPLYAVARALAELLASLPLPSRNRLRRNLSRASGESLASGRLAALVRQAHRTQLTNYVDLMRSRRISDAEVSRRVQSGGPGWDAMIAAVRERRGAVLVTAHFGQLELLNHFLTQFGLPITLPVEHLRPARLFDLICALRSFRGVQLVPHDAALRACLRALRRGELVALFAEWDPSGHGVPVQFFGAPARFPQGPAFLALRSGAPLFVGLALPASAPGSYFGWVELVLEHVPTGDFESNLREVSQRIATSLERHIGNDPGRWVMFHDLWAGGVPQSSANAPSSTEPAA